MELAGQISMMEICPEMYPDPELWECMETCEHVGEYMNQFPLGGERCMYGERFHGTTGADLYSKVINNTVHIYCKYYKRRAGNDQQAAGTDHADYPGTAGGLPGS